MDLTLSNTSTLGFPGGSGVKKKKKKICLPMQKTQVQYLENREDLEKGMATLSSITAWEIPWTKESGGLLSMG